MLEVSLTHHLEVVVGSAQSYIGLCMRMHWSILCINRQLEEHLETGNSAKHACTGMVQFWTVQNRVFCVTFVCLPAGFVLKFLVGYSITCCSTYQLLKICALVFFYIEEAFCPQVTHEWPIQTFGLSVEPSVQFLRNKNPQPKPILLLF